MKWGKLVAFGFIVWLVPFVIAFMIYMPLENNKPLFDSIMAVVLASTTSLVALFWMRKEGTKQSVVVGIVWMFISVVIDAPLFLVGGPMYMSVEQYLSDIAACYLMLPVLTFVVAAAASGKEK